MTTVKRLPFHGIDQDISIKYGLSLYQTVVLLNIGNIRDSSDAISFNSLMKDFPIFDLSYLEIYEEFVDLANNGYLDFFCLNEAYEALERGVDDLDWKMVLPPSKPFLNSFVSESLGISSFYPKAEETPSLDYPSTKTGCIYLVKEKNDGHIKIGRTVDIKSRLRTFSVKLPFKVDLIHSFKSSDYISAEKLLHRHFQSKRVDGEWFLLTELDIEKIKCDGFLSELGIRRVE